MSYTESAIKILERATEILEPRGAWTQGSFALSREKTSVPSDSPRAVCFCALGAIQRARFDLGFHADYAAEVTYDTNPAIEALCQVIDDRDIDEWNDISSRRKGEVIAKMHEAISILKGDK